MLIQIDIHLSVNLKNCVAGVIKNGRDHSGHGTIILVVSEKGKDEIHWFFAPSCKFRKARNYVKNFWLKIVKNRSGQMKDVSANEALKSNIGRLILPITLKPT